MDGSVSLEVGDTQGSVQLDLLLSLLLSLILWSWFRSTHVGRSGVELSSYFEFLFNTQMISKFLAHINVGSEPVILKQFGKYCTDLVGSQSGFRPIYSSLDSGPIN